MKRCECWNKELNRRRKSFASIPETFEDCRLSNFDLSLYKDRQSKQIIEGAIEIVHMWFDMLDDMKQRGLGLYLFSDTKGSGKTRMAASIANELMLEHNMQVKFSTAARILTEIRDTYNKESTHTESKLLDDLANSSVLVIDDFGTEKVTDWANEKVYEIINDRYVAKKITIFTSNICVKDLQYNARIKNRVQERVVEVQFPEESIRDYIAEENNNLFYE